MNFLCPLLTTSVAEPASLVVYAGRKPDVATIGGCVICDHHRLGCDV